MGGQQKMMRLSLRIAKDPVIQALSEEDQRRLMMILGYDAEFNLKEAPDKHLSFFMRIPLYEWRATKGRLLDANLITEDEDGLQVGPRASGSIPKDERVPPRLRHGMSRRGQVAPEYSCWVGMRQRCNNPNHQDYAYYGGRFPNPIKVCKEWNKSFEAFFHYVGPRPGRKYSLDRIDNDKGYEPGNVRWAIRKIQANNKRNSKNRPKS